MAKTDVNQRQISTLYFETILFFFQIQTKIHSFIFLPLLPLVLQGVMMKNEQLCYVLIRMAINNKYCMSLFVNGIFFPLSNWHGHVDCDFYASFVFALE